jgi:hypothetical protein
MDGVRLKPFDFAQAVARAGLQPNGHPLSAPRTSAVEGGGGFAAAMSDALKSVSAQQVEAQRMQREVQLDNPTVSLEPARLPGGAAGAQPVRPGLYGHHEHGGLILLRRTPRVAAIGMGAPAGSGTGSRTKRSTR